MEIKDWLGEDNKLGQDIWKKKYCYENETFDSWLERITNSNTQIKKLILEKKFLFGGRILSNRGLQQHGKNISYSNCYVIPSPQDSMSDIMRCASEMAETYKTGGGCGINLNNLRPNGAAVNNNAKSSTGPISFMDLYSTVTGVVAQNGRRGALMIAMEVSHPDIEEFIQIKQNLDKVDKANISVMMNDNFMKAVIADTNYQLYFKTAKGQEFKKTVKAREIMQKIAFNAWDMGEPGMLFWDRVTNWNLMQGVDSFKLECTNPCLVKDTLVHVADGRGLVSIGELAEIGRDVEVFCYTKEGHLSVKIMRHPRITGYNEQIYKIVIDGGYEIRCTGNHKLLLDNGTYIEAKNISANDKLNCIQLPKSQISLKDSLPFGANIYNNLADGRVKKYCEICNREFIVDYNSREQSICNHNSCIQQYKHLDRSISLSNEHKCVNVISINTDGFENVYNGTVDEYHNFFISFYSYCKDNDSHKLLLINNLNCGELPLVSGGACLLGSLNLSEYVKNPFKPEASFDFKQFSNDVMVCITELDVCLTESSNLHALQIQKEAAEKFRSIGLGVMGVAHMSIKLGLAYGSDEFVSLMDKIGFELANSSIKQSALLAQACGKAPCLENYKNSLLTANEFIKKNTTPQTLKLVAKYGLRNAQLLTTAPTGSISTMIETSGGIEPLYDCSYIRTTKTLHAKDTDYEVFEKVVEDYKKINKKIPDWIRNSTAKKLDYFKRIVVQSTWQKHIDNAISSTINLPESTTAEDIVNIYIKSWELGLKGVTIFRDNCRRIGILNSKSDKKAEKEVKKDDNLKWGDTIKSSDDLIGFKKKLNTGCGSLHVQAFFDHHGNFREIYLSKGSTGGCNSFMVGLSRMISLAARAGISLEKIVDQLHSTMVCPSYVKRAYTSAGTSCPNALGHALVEIQTQSKNYFNANKPNDKKDMDPVEKEELKKKEETIACPECGVGLIIQEGCISCKACGYSKC